MKPIFRLCTLLLVCQVTLSACASSIAQSPETLASQPQKPQREAVTLPDHPKVQHWILLFAGYDAEAEGTQAKALERYRKILPTSAAYPDALTRILLIEPAGATSERLTYLENILKSARRSDLAPSVVQIRALRAEREGDLAEALKLYQHIRKRHSRSDTATVAKLESERLAQTIGQLSEEALVAEAELLVAEGEAARGIAMIEQLRDQSPKSRYYELKAIEERLLRRAGQRAAADAVLVELSVKAPTAIAEAALHQRIRLAWNANQQAATQALIAQFRSRFPASDLSTAVLYINGRVYEELGEFSKAEQVYRSYADVPSTDLVTRQQASTQLAWLALNRGDKLAAAKELAKLRSLTITEQEQALKLAKSAQGANTRSVYAITQSLAHHSYWLGETLRTLAASNSPLPSELKALSPASIRSELARITPFGYYSFLAGQDSLPELQKLSSSGAESRCAPGSTSIDSTLLKLLTDAEENGLAEREINWYFSQTDPSSKLNPKLEDLRRAELFSRHGSPKLAISSAESFLRNQNEASTSAGCVRLALQLSRPKPYRTEFSRAASTYGVPESLLLAIARTESHFDPMALSGKDARGLLQLIPPTAKMEGWNGSDSLFEPTVNVPLGAKHFAGLLKRYQGERVFAIAAYNAGSAAVERWKGRFGSVADSAWIEQIPYSETRNYVKKVLLDEYLYRTLH